MISATLFHNFACYNDVMYIILSVVGDGGGGRVGRQLHVK